MLVAGTKVRFEKGKLRQCVVLHVGEILRHRRYMGAVHYQRAARVPEDVLAAVGEVFEYGGGTSIRIRVGVVDLP